MRNFQLDGGDVQISACINSAKLYNQGYDVFFLTFSISLTTYKIKGK